MSRYRVELEKAARRQLLAVRDRRVRDALEAAILALAEEPRPPGVKKLKGFKDRWRVRVEDWRVVYRIEGEEGSGLGPIRRSSGATEPTNARSASGGLRLVVLVVAVAKRDEVYR